MNKFKKLEKKEVRIAFIVFWVVIVFLILFLFVNASIKSSKPGDLLFSLKQSQEDSSSKINILKDRVNSVNSLVSQSNCIQLVLAEESLIDSLKQLNSEKNNFLEIYNEVKNINLNSECSENNRLKYLANIYKTLAISNENNQIELERDIKESKNKYSEITEKLKTANFKTQEDLNKINKVLLKYEQNNSNLNSLLTGEDFKSVNKLINQNILIFDYVETHLSSTEFITPREIIFAICRIETGELCTENNIESKWNSIKTTKDSVQMIELSSDIIDNYLLNFQE